MQDGLSGAVDFADKLLQIATIYYKLKGINRG